MFYLKRNLPLWERALRLCLGALTGAIAHFYVPSGILMWLAFATGITLAGTAAAGFCPACAMLGRRALDGRS